MAESSNSSSNNGLYFIVGGLVVVVAVFTFMFLGGHMGSLFGGPMGGHSGKMSITIEAPKTP